MDITAAQSAHCLLTHRHRLPAGEPDGRFCRQDLVELFMVDGAERDVMGAAFVLSLPPNFIELDTAAGLGPADGYAGRQDLIAAASQRLCYQEAVEIVALHPELDTAAGLGQPDGRFGREDLAAVLKGDGDPSLQEAAYYFLSRPEDYNRLGNTAGLGTPNDGYVGWQDLQTALMAPLAAFS